MKADRRFRGESHVFWANVRLLGEAGGYTVRGSGRVKVPTPSEMAAALVKAGVGARHLVDDRGRLTGMGSRIEQYFRHRAKVLNQFVEPRLMTAGRARKEFLRLKALLRPKRAIPRNKQKGRKRRPAYLTGMVNMLIEAHAGGTVCDFDPHRLTAVTRDGLPLRTLARRVDGAFPGPVDPIAVWEIKEYYYTTTFGSRVADGVYESLLDGLEIEELREHEGIEILHYLIVDAHYTWWECGKSYLCRIIDMLHMGYADEVLFGSEVLERLPRLVAEWRRRARARRLVASTRRAGFSRRGSVPRRGSSSGGRRTR